MINLLSTELQEVSALVTAEELKVHLVRIFIPLLMKASVFGRDSDWSYGGLDGQETHFQNMDFSQQRRVLLLIQILR